MSADANGLCTRTALCPLHYYRRVIEEVTERLEGQDEHGQAGAPLSARQQPDVLPNVRVQSAALPGGLNVAARGGWLMG